MSKNQMLFGAAIIGLLIAWKLNVFSIVGE
jgi:hypothetical protein